MFNKFIVLYSGMVIIYFNFFPQNASMYEAQFISIEFCQWCTKSNETCQGNDNLSFNNYYKES